MHSMNPIFEETLKWFEETNGHPFELPASELEVKAKTNKK